MSTASPRLRMFAGPNGSGKSTVKALVETKVWFGVYVNADDLERGIREGHAVIDLAPFGITFSLDELRAFFRSSALMAKAKRSEDIEFISLNGTRVDFGAMAIDSYTAAVLADFIRQKRVVQRETVSFETVMSGPDKVDFFRAAKEKGYRTYLYYVATEDPLINIERVKERVAAGGHDVPDDKVVQRYERSLDKLMDAIMCADRAFVWDNSGESLELLAEFTDGIEEWDLKVEQAPEWFNRAVLNKLQALGLYDPEE